jgi:hypothetical protein
MLIIIIIIIIIIIVDHAVYFPRLMLTSPSLDTTRCYIRVSGDRVMASFAMGGGGVKNYD